jgi:uncharacterized membrane protein YidH (DUF202 family)
MSNIFYEAIGRVVWVQAKRQVRNKFSGSSIRYGAIGAVVIGVVAVGAVLARSHAPSE